MVTLPEAFVPEIPPELRTVHRRPPLPEADDPWTRARWINQAVAAGDACAVTHAALVDLLDAAVADLAP